MKKIILGTLVLSVAAFATVNLGSCKACHGQNFEKKALGKSKIVKDMTKEEVSSALIGYKDGTYGGPMKGLMKGQVVRYSDTELSETGIGTETSVVEPIVEPIVEKVELKKKVK